MNDVKKVLSNIDKGFYPAAKAKGTNALAYLTDLIAPEPPQVDQVRDRLLRRMEKGHHVRISDDSAMYQNVSDWAYQCVGLELAMKAAGIKRGDTVDKAFFSSSNATGTQGIFPAFLASQIISGQMAVSLVPICCLAEIRIGSHVQEKVQINDTADTRQTRHIDEGVDMPKTTIAKLQGSIALQKYGRMLEATYETVRLMHLDIISLQLQRMGRQIGIDETATMVETYIQGDGNSGSAATTANNGGDGVFDYDDWTTMFLSFPIGYEMRQTIANDTQIKQTLGLAQFQDPLAGYPHAGFNTQFSGILPGPLGASLHRWTDTGSVSFTGGVLAIDDRLSMVLYREGDLLEEADQLIDKQLHRRTMSEWIGFMVWDPKGAVWFTIT